MTATVALIGGTGIDRWPGFQTDRAVEVETPFGPPSGHLLYGHVHGTQVVFLARHGPVHALPPHRINYRANIWALKSAGIRSVVAVAAVGGIARWLPPAQVAVPVDLVDYTHGRAHTYSDSQDEPLSHAEFTAPYSERIRRELLHAALSQGIDVAEGGVLAVTQGPRLETAAEIRRLQLDGCDMVGMTGMPEAALARELGLDYACLAVCVNWAAGLGGGDTIHTEIADSLEAGMNRVQRILSRVIPALRAQDPPGLFEPGV